MSRPAAKKELGQHFLVDENLLGVIDRFAELGPEDVVLEVGPGLGMLTNYLADRVAHVHAVELDRSLELAGFSTRDEATEALRAIGRDPATRAEELAPPEFVALAEALPA